jgi:alkylation response protein AidB-like acyl-CoA dehydrogenase
VDFDDTPEEAAFRAEARAWLEEHAPAHVAPRTARASGGDDWVRRCKAWQRTLYDGGWAGITWPKEYGGRGGTSLEQRVFDQEQARFGAAAGVFAVGIGMVGPTLIAHGSEAQKARYLDPLLQGEEVWCQLFSEPGAGSDLAALATRAVRDGDEFVVDGQKVWTSGAHNSQLGILLARTNPDVPKHRGITYFVVDMAAPGVEVRPLRQINGAAHFNEVFLSGVRVPADNVVGEVDGGWGVTLTTLGSERSLIGGGMGGTGFPQLLELARAHDATADPLRRQEIAAAFTRFEVLRFLGYRVQTALSQHRLPGAEASVLKLAYSRHTAALADLAMALTGATGTLLGGEDLDEVWRQQFLGQWSSRIGGGTDQIQGNVIAERVLGLPRDARPDKDVPFRELARPAR